MTNWMGRLAALALCLCLLAGFCGGGNALAEDAGEAEDITRKCSVKVSEKTDDKDRMFDTTVSTAWWAEHRDGYVGIKIPDGKTAGYLRLEWFFEPTDFTLTEYDANMTVLRERDRDDTFPCIYMLFDLLSDTKYLKLQTGEKDQKIVNLRVYSAGTLPKKVQRWEPPVQKADVMVVSAHQDDELIFLGGTIPYYATALKKPTVVVYMANCSRNRRREALNALWVMGVKNYPEFINLVDDKADSVNQVYALWGGEDYTRGLVVQRIRRYKPEVIVTHDLGGEYGHAQHKATARIMMSAIEAAADPTQYPESAEVYGAWQVKKLYHHLYEENQIMMDWETKLDSLNGYSPLQVAQLGFKEHSSQDKYYNVKSHSKYDNAKFGLYYTTVGQDVEKKDFLENIDPDATANYLAEHAEEIAAYPIWPDLAGAQADDAPTGDEEGVVDEAEDMSDIPAHPDDALPTAQPAATPQPTAQPAGANENRGGGAGVAVAMIALGAAAVGGALWYAVRLFGGGKKRRRKKKRRR